MTAATIPTFLAIVDRVEAVLDAETDALSRHQPVDLVDLGCRKRQGLLELNRIMRALAGKERQDEVRDRLAQLASKLERNRRTLDIQLRAVREISDIIAGSLREAESDGTYSILAVRQ